MIKSVITNGLIHLLAALHGVCMFPEHHFPNSVPWHTEVPEEGASSQPVTFLIVNAV